MVSVTFYMFRHLSAIFRESIKTEEQKFSMPSRYRSPSLSSWYYNVNILEYTKSRNRSTMLWHQSCMIVSLIICKVIAVYISSVSCILPHRMWSVAWHDILHALCGWDPFGSHISKQMFVCIFLTIIELWWPSMVDFCMSALCILEF